MPARYFFRLVHSDDVIEDPEGVVADTFTQARAEALTAIDELRDAGQLPEDAADWNLEIRDETGEMLQSIRLG